MAGYLCCECFCEDFEVQHFDGCPKADHARAQKPQERTHEAYIAKLEALLEACDPTMVQRVQALCIIGEWQDVMTKIARLAKEAREAQPFINWQPIETAPENVEVLTKIHDEHGERMKQRLIRFGRHWFYPDKSTCIYYVPTHWAYTEARP